MHGGCFQLKTVVFNSVCRVNNNTTTLRLMVKTNHSTLHTVYNVQQSATQGRNDTDCHAGQQ